MHENRIEVRRRGREAEKLFERLGSYLGQNVTSSSQDIVSVTVQKTVYFSEVGVFSVLFSVSFTACIRLLSFVHSGL